MEPNEKIELRIPSILGFEKVAMECVSVVAKNLGFSDSRIEDIKTAVSEACTNAMEHGNKLKTDTKVGITLKVMDSDFYMEIKDEGSGVGKVEVPKIEDKIDGTDATRGWGIFLIKNLMDEVKFIDSPEGDGNVLRMMVHLEQQAQS